MELIIIAVVYKNRVIGSEASGQEVMPGFMPNWLGQIQALTRPVIDRANVAVAVGRNTANLLGLLERPIFDDVPNIVLSKSLSSIEYQIDGVSIISGLPQLRMTCSALDAVFAIGGHSTYSRLIGHASELWLYEVDADLRGTLKFPPWDKGLYELYSQESVAPRPGFMHACTFAKYRLRSLSSGQQGMLF